MTKQEFVKNEACIYAEKVSFQVPYNGTNDFYNEERLKTSTIDFSDGLSKGLEIAEKFSEFISKYKYDDIRGYCSMFNDGSHGKAHISPKYYTTSELLTIFLTEINEKK